MKKITKKKVFGALLLWQLITFLSIFPILTGDDILHCNYSFFTIWVIASAIVVGLIIFGLIGAFAIKLIRE